MPQFSYAYSSENVTIYCSKIWFVDLLHVDLSWCLDALRRNWREKSEDGKKSDDPELLPLGVRKPAPGVQTPGHRRH
ncbi:hypothetical protein AAC387_Pa07g2110 [Persea americana]